MAKKHKTVSKQKASSKSAKPNPFELKGTKGKFDVLGRRTKSGKQNVVKARQEALVKRKKTLLVEYKQLRKANTFIDRRFGEDDPQLGEEDKALVRFKAQRVRDAKKKAGKFALGDDHHADADDSSAGLSLTHMGRSLSELQDLSQRPDELADLDDDLLEQMVAQYNFGGGGDDGGDAAAAAAATGEGRAGDGAPRTRKQVMEEIIAKSKMYKAIKAQQKEDDLQQLEDLDAQFKQLVQAGGGGSAGRRTGPLAALVKPPGFDKGKKTKPDNDEDAQYDQAARELVFEAKAQAGDRTLTPEELADKEKQRLEALEKQRLKRMREAFDNADDDGDGGDVAGDGQGFAAKRRRQQKEQSGDALDENFDLSDEEQEGDDETGEDDDDVGGSDEEGDDDNDLSALDRRRKERAAGEHPLQVAFREQAAKLAEKYGVAGPAAHDSEQDDDDDDRDDVDVGDADSDDEDDDDEEEEELGSADGDDDDDEHGVADEDEAASLGDGGSHDGGEEDEQQQQQQRGRTLDAALPDQGAAALQQRRAAGAAASTSAPATVDTSNKHQKPSGRHITATADEAPLDLPYTIPLPDSYAAFAKLVNGRPAEQLALAVQRIRMFNAAALATDSKRKLQVLYGLLVQHFAMLAGERPVPKQHLDVLLGILLELTSEVPFYAATVARARITKMHERLSQALADPLSESHYGWPGARQLLQCMLFATLFPVSDRRHPVITPLALLLGKWLMQCPVPGPYEAALGLAVCGVALHMAAPAQRFMPEVQVYLTNLFNSFLPVGDKGSSTLNAGGLNAQGVNLFTPGVLSGVNSTTAQSNGSRLKQQAQHQQHKPGPQTEQVETSLPKLDLYSLLSCDPADLGVHSQEFRHKLLGCALATASRAADISAATADAVPEILAPLASAVAALADVSDLHRLAPHISSVANELQQVIQDATKHRTPMVQSFRVKATLPREYNPRFEADYAKGRDYDPDRDRSSARRLQRQLVKEKRGAMRELRRDASFMAHERDTERAQVDTERLASERKFYAELQFQEADAKSGGQRGMNPHRKNKKK